MRSCRRRETSTRKGQSPTERTSPGRKGSKPGRENGAQSEMSDGPDKSRNLAREGQVQSKGEKALSEENSALFPTQSPGRRACHISLALPAAAPLLRLSRRAGTAPQMGRANSERRSPGAPATKIAQPAQLRLTTALPPHSAIQRLTDEAAAPSARWGQYRYRKGKRERGRKTKKAACFHRPLLCRHCPIFPGSFPPSIFSAA